MSKLRTVQIQEPFNITGSLYGTSSWAKSSSFALTASFASSTVPVDLSGYTTTSSFNSFTSSYYSDSQSFDSRITNNSSSLSLLSGSFESFSESYNTGSFTGSFIGDGSQLTGIVSSKWSGSNPITRESNVEITGSLKVTQGITGSFYGTASWAQSASISISSSYAKSASYAITTSYALDADLLDGKDSSTFATTGSNIFYGLQTISASNPDPSALDIHVEDDFPWAFRIYNDTYSSTSIGLASWIDNSGISFLGTETDQPLHIYNNANYYGPTLLISSSGVTVGAGGITGSLHGTSSWADNSLTASFITSSNIYGPYGSNSVSSSSYALSASYAESSSYSFSSSYAISSSYAESSSYAFSSSYSLSSSYSVSSSHTLSSSFASTASYVNPLHQNVIITGSLLVTQSHISTVDYIDFTPVTTAPAFLTGRLHWTDDTKTLQLDTDVNNFELEIGHQSVVRGRNTNSFTLTKGTVVYINGESGNRPTFATASWEGDPSSATTIGIVAQDINSNQTGYVVTDGLIRGIDTNAFLPGTSLYLSSSGDYTSTPPASPLHEVRLGKTITQATQGIIYVDIMNGYELGELHDVLITNVTNGDLISWNSGSRVWKNTKQLTGSYGLTGSLSVLGNTQLNGPVYISSSLTVLGNSTFFGSSSFVYVTASQLAVSASTISVNVFEPVQRFGGLVIYDSGSSNATASFLWDSLHNHFVYQTVSGSSYAGGMFLSGPRNTGSLGDEPTLTAYFIPRSDGGDHLNDSQIYSSGSTHIVTGSLTVTDGVSGSFSGSGADLFNIPASGIVGLNLSQIATGSVTASVSPTQFSVTSGSSTELVVTGTGVTIGSALTDTHTITGSLFITGSIEDGGSGHILTYNTQSGQIFFTASSAIGGGGVTSLGSGSFGATFDGAGGVVAINKTVYVRVPTAVSMSSWEMVSQPTGSCVVSVFADSYGNYPPTSPTDDIFSVYPSISLASSSQNTSPTFVTSNVLPAGSWVGFRTVSVTGSVWISISVNGVKA